ncbi:CLUMA_CG004878, isoform A [Clunio marinus]|uniref:CLUMA_CG004878, isoform A n=1 Tax=Clunio marinus TaxID=568069 RepID=A0A1J1HT70_9DIPT|nr:CLUMA_CG004878, isoform A [Clunio marinus]
MHDNDTISQELKEILDRARELLCDIELFVNATSNKNGSHKPHWYDARSMSEIVTLENDENNPRLKIHGIFLKARFQEYVNKLYKRIRTFKLDRNLKSGKFRRTSTIQPHKNHRRNRPGRRRKTTVRYNGEPAVTEKTYIITTRNPRRGSKTSRRTRTPGQKRQRQNKIIQNLQ